MRFKNIISFPLIIILVGVGFSLFLQSYIADGVFFSGDAGLKVLLAEQFAKGEFHADIATPSVAWVRDLWNYGLYPYEPPFVYNLNDKYFITFPYTFPLITAPFYALFGERGLYIIPLIATWIIWLTFYWVCQKNRLNQLSISLGLTSLIFASYLTIYSAMYWEHTLAVALAFGGMSLYLVGNPPQLRSNFIAIASGFLIGFSVWFRPEFLCLVALFFGLAILTSINFFVSSIVTKFLSLKEIKFLAVKKEIFVVSMLTTVAGFFLSNKLVYGHTLGIHGFQAVKPIPWRDRLIGTCLNFKQMSLALIEYSPAIFFLVVVSIYLYLFRNTIQTRLNLQFLLLVFLVCLLFIIGVSFLVPVGTASLIPGGKQWGVRFLLILVPVISLLIAIYFNFLDRQLSWQKYILLIFLILLMAKGIHKNIFQATTSLENNNQKTLPAIEFIRQNSNQIIAISNQYAAQALESSLMNNKILFKVENTRQLIKLSQILIEQAQENITYICYPHQRCDVIKAKPEDLKFTQGDRNYQIIISNLGTFGKYPIYEMKIK